MFGLKTILIASLVLFVLATVVGSGHMAEANAFTRFYASGTEAPSRELKVVAEGFHSSINEAFVAVIRDRESYAALKTADSSLPALDAAFFSSNALVAAFLGERNTGGYGVEIALEPDGQIRVSEKKPGKGMMVPQVITSPFKIVSIDGGSRTALRLSLDEAWRRRMQRYRITSGTFTMQGGFVGVKQEFGLEGEIGVIRTEKFVTMAFDVRSVNSAKKRALIDFASGTVDNDSQMNLERFSSGTLVDSPNLGLQATGSIREEGKKISLEIGSRMSTISDGFIGSGKIEAEAPPPAQKSGV